MLSRRPSQTLASAMFALPNAIQGSASLHNAAKIKVFTSFTLNLPSTKTIARQIYF
jgi:hypothetical protein